MPTAQSRELARRFTGEWRDRRDVARDLSGARQQLGALPAAGTAA